MVNKFDIDQLRLQIEALIREYPDLEEDELLRADMLSGATDMDEALVALFETSTNAKLMVGSITVRLKALMERRARMAHRVEVCRNLILSVMQAANLKRVELPDATLSQSRGVPQIVGEVDANALPADLCRVTIEPNRTAIREALTEGRVLPGLSLGNAPPSLRVYVR